MFNRKKTLRKVKKHDPGTKRYELHKQAKATLGLGNAKEAVKKPEGETLDDWLAMNTIEIYNQLNILYGNICEHCTVTSCPHMNAGPKYQYLWPQGKSKPLDLPAPQYIDRLMEWIEDQFDDVSIFPPNVGQPYPKDFPKIVSQIFRKMFRVYAHIYYSHFGEMVVVSEAHLNSAFKFFHYFVQEFNLVSKADLMPLEETFERLSLADK
eukprot:TRINITY_DN10314_c0_g1_i1.p1 TRINITY_DN10314_c0_g1~~TRINITY_DN10314_c0_g1_i1.p1  ORF type:complete len:209 (-),score=48.19 TRINITY_DN10314_c0_g1_i1:128-754(-)